MRVADDDEIWSEVSNCASAFTGLGPPTITSIRDVPNDQGGEVMIVWDRAPTDQDYGVPDQYFVTHYSVWRLEDSVGGGNGGWMNLGWVPAMQFEAYAYEAPTPADSSELGIPYFTFMISAMTADSLVYADSDPDSGYSVDNLCPSPPANLRVVPPELLVWSANTDDDLACYSIYSGAHSGFDPDSTNLLHTTVDTVYCLSGSPGGFLVVTATDHSGNESGPSNEVSWTAGLSEDTGEENWRFSLGPNHPNPFGSATVIQYSVGARGRLVEIGVYDVRGNLVRTIVQSALEPGRYSASWDGLDSAGKPVGSGLYLVRMQAGEYSKTRKMLLVR
jgi:hypothetical protein